MIFSYNGRVIRSVQFVGRGISNLAIYDYLRKRYPQLDFSFSNEECEADIIFFSPSAKREGYFECGAELSSDAELYFSLSPSRKLAVSGSDGKSTTATVASRLLEGSYLCGNIGIPFSTCIERTADAVCELSSFQLNYFAPRLYSSVISSISENHIDWHGSFAAYLAAKENLLKNSEHISLWADGEYERELIRKYMPQRILSIKKSFNELKGIYGDRDFITLEGGRICLNGEDLTDTECISRYGIHTVKNFMSAVALTLHEVDAERVRTVQRNFTPLPHRCELVCERGGVRYYDSSIDSTPARTATTLATFKHGVVLILGGRSKGLDFSALIPAMKGVTRAAVLYGECAEEIRSCLEKSDEFRDTDIALTVIPDFDGAVRYAARNARCGECVLLSPAATSYDCFANYRERAEAFKRIILSDKD